MPSATALSSPRRVALAGLLAVALLGAPIWVPALHLDDPTYTYERLEVVVDEEDGITLVNDSTFPGSEQLSDRLGCTHPLEDYRLCGFERQLQDEGTVPSGWYTSNPGRGISSAWARYQYLQLNGTTYEAVTRVNESVTNENGLYSVDLALERVDHDAVLDAISRDTAETEALDVHPRVVDAAEEGSATSHEEIDVPATVFAVEDGYYRVYKADESGPAATGGALSALLYWGCPPLGVWILLHLRRYVDVRYAAGRSD